MKIVTGNSLFDGRVVYLSPEGAWTPRIHAAALMASEDAEAALADAKSRAGEIAEAYLMDATLENGVVKPSGRAALRETVRSAGPTISYGEAGVPLEELQ